MAGPGDLEGVRRIDELVADTRFAMRALRRNSGFFATSVSVLGLAIGAATAIFAVVHAVLLAELPYPHAERLVRIFQQNSPTNRWSLSVVDILAMRDQQHSFDAFGGIQLSDAALNGAGEPEQVDIRRVTAGVFEVFDVAPGVGRPIEPRDEAVGAPLVAVVTSSFAERRLGGATAAIGRTITLDGLSHTIVGVLPAGVDDIAGMRPPVWAALQMRPPTRRGPFGYRAVGRLKEEVTVEQAARDLAGISQRIYPIWKAGFADSVAKLTPYPLRETIVGMADRQLWLFAGAVVLVLLVAIANVATLMLVRASSRAHELSIRATLGASRARLMRLVMTESVVLTSAAGAVGVGIAAIGLRFLRDIAPALPRAREVTLGWEPVLAAVALTVASGLLVSISPAAALLSGGITSSRAESRRSGGGRWANRLRGALVGAEFALAVPLLLGAALLANSFVRLQHVNPGYNAHSTFSVRLGLSPLRYDSPQAVAQFWRRARQRALEMPGVIAAGLATDAPPDNQGNTNNFNLVAHPVPPGSPEPDSPWSSVTAGFFEALEIPLLEGRLFTEADSGAAPPVAIVSRSWAARYFRGEHAVGQQLIEGGCTSCPLTTIVGIVGDVKYQGLPGNGDGVYVPLEQSGSRDAMLFVRTRGAPQRAIRPAIEGIRALDPELPLAGVTMAEQLRRALADPGRWTAILWSFASAALALCAMGIFGLLSYLVRRQRREIGVRIALGAEPGAVMRMIIGRGMRYVVPGTLVGLGLAMLEGPWIGSLLFGVAPRDLTTMVGVTATLLVLALVSCIVPAARAARIRAIEAIATE